jgi:ribosome-associated toxin RatA of RatAB toxin-antitoxin module
MSRVERSALVRASAERMFELVNGVEEYPRRFGWCVAASVQVQDAQLLLARLEVKVGGVRTAFTTRNSLEPGRSIRIELVEGPFTRLSGFWQFQPLGEEASKVSLTLEFDFAGKLVGSALASGFRGVADRMVDDFVRESKRLDG